MFAIVNILRAIIARSLVDPVLIVGFSATAIASKIFHTLRSIYFISSRLGSERIFRIYLHILDSDRYTISLSGSI